MIPKASMLTRSLVDATGGRDNGSKVRLRLHELWGAVLRQVHRHRQRVPGSRGLLAQDAVQSLVARLPQCFACSSIPVLLSMQNLGLGSHQYWNVRAISPSMRTSILWSQQFRQLRANKAAEENQHTAQACSSGREGGPLGVPRLSAWRLAPGPLGRGRPLQRAGCRPVQSSSHSLCQLLVVPAIRSPVWNRAVWVSKTVSD